MRKPTSTESPHPHPVTTGEPPTATRHLTPTRQLVLGLGIFLCWMCMAPPLIYAEGLGLDQATTRLVIPILGTSFNVDKQLIGVVFPLEIRFKQRADHQGIHITFREQPGILSSYSKQAIIVAIWYAAEAAHLQPDSWEITITNPYPGLTLYGDSLSAMVGLSVVALAKGDPLIPGRAITGTITQDGHIGKVAGVPFKIAAAHAKHIQRVLVPEEQDIGDGDWRTPFLMQISPVGTVAKAYRALTDQPL